MTYVKATGTGGTLTVPSGVSAGDILYLIAVVPETEGTDPGYAVPDGMTWFTSDFYNLDGGQQGTIYEPFVHDGRSTYTFPSAPSTRSVGVFVKSVNPAGHDIGDGGPISDYAVFVTFAYSYSGVGQRQGGGDPFDGSEIGWGFFGDAVTLPSASSLLLLSWFASDQTGDTVLFDYEVVPAVPNVELFPAVGLASAYGAVTYMRDWPGNNTNPFEYDWTSNGWLVNRLGTPPLRQNQRDDIRQGQRTSRQLTVRQVGYL